MRSVDYLYIKYINTKYTILSIHKCIQKIMNKGPNIIAVSRNKNNSPIPFYLICPLISPAFFTKNSVISSNDSLSKTVVGSKSAAHTSTPDRSTSSDWATDWGTKWIDFRESRRQRQIVKEWGREREREIEREKRREVQRHSVVNKDRSSDQEKGKKIKAELPLFPLLLLLPPPLHLLLPPLSCRWNHPKQH